MRNAYTGWKADRQNHKRLAKFLRDIPENIPAGTLWPHGDMCLPVHMLMIFLHEFLKSDLQEVRFVHHDCLCLHAAELHAPAVPAFVWSAWLPLFERYAAGFEDQDEFRQYRLNLSVGGKPQPVFIRIPSPRMPQGTREQQLAVFEEWAKKTIGQPPITWAKTPR